MARDLLKCQSPDDSDRASDDHGNGNIFCVTAWRVDTHTCCKAKSQLTTEEPGQL